MTFVSDVPASVLLSYFATAIFGALNVDISVTREDECLRDEKGIGME